MNLKTSFFNKTLFKANIRRFWWIGVIYFIALITFGILPLVNDQTTDGFVIMNVISCGIAALMPTILFSYLDSAAPVTCMHALPIKRKAHFITHIVTIYAMLLIPAIICYIAGGIYIAATPHLIDYPVRTLKDFAEMFFSLAILITIFASGGVLGNMVTGNSIAAVVFSALFIALPYYTEAIFASFLQMNVHGIWEYDYLTLTNFHIYEVNTYMIVSCIIWFLVFFVSWLLYKNRKLEANGDIIAFDFLKPVFVGCVSVFLGFLGYFYFVSLLRRESIFWLLPFGLLGIIISNMLSKKAFTFKCAIKSGVIYIIGVTLLYAVITYDLTGYERRIPDLGKIASVRITDDRYTARYNEDNLAYMINHEKYYYTSPLNKSELDFTEKEDIENVMALHEKLIKSKDDLTSRSHILPIVYTLTDGSTIKRKYAVDYYTDADVLKPVYETEQMRLDKYTIFRSFEKTIDTITVNDSRIVSNNTFMTLSGNSEKAKALLEAMRLDAMETDYYTVVNYNDTATKIRISYNRPAKTPDGKALDYEKYGYTDSISIGITSSFVRTRALLEEYGLYDKVIKPEQISYATVAFNDKGEKDRIKFTDKEQIKQLYDFCFNPTYYRQSSLPQNVWATSVIFYGNNNNLLFEEYKNYQSDWPEFLLNAAKDTEAAQSRDVPMGYGVTTEQTLVEVSY